MTLIHGLACACGEPSLISVAPGSDGDDFADLFAVKREQPARGYCASCWARKFGTAAPTDNNEAWSV